MQYDLLGYVDFLYLLRRLWTSAPCDRSVAVSQMSIGDAVDITKICLPS